MYSPTIPSSLALALQGGVTQITEGGAIASQADVIWRGILCWRDMASAVWEMTQPRDLGSLSLCFLTRATSPRLSSYISSSFCLPSARSQSVGLQTENHVLGSRGSLFLCLSLLDRNCNAFHSRRLSGFLSQFWFLGWGPRLGS